MSRSGQICNAVALLQLTENSPTAALTTVDEVLEGRAPVIHVFTLVKSHLLAARAPVE